MDAKDYVVNEVLRDPRRFMVPIYQRQYQWGRKRLEPLWDDIVAKADEVLEGNARFMHYMGALILAPTGDADNFATTPSIQVVDGQQRLTSFQLFLAALREQALTLAVEDVGPAVREYLFNEPKSKDTDPHTRFKLSPTPSDRKLFWTLMEKGMPGAKELHPDLFYKNGNLIYGQAPPALSAYYYFLDCVRTYALWGVGRRDSGIGADAADPDMAAERIDALLKAVLTRMKLVVIALGEADDAQVIFETLNSQAEPLLAMDLVRNNIFHRAEKQLREEATGASVETLHAELWQPFETQFWKADAPRARPVRPRIEHFLSHALTAQTGTATSMRELYAEYRAFAKPKGIERFPNVGDELKALTRYVAAYRTLEGEVAADTHLAWLGRKLATWEVTTAYPVAFQIATSPAEREERRSLYQLLYSFIVRRGICELGAKNLNNVFQRLATTFLRDGVSLDVAVGALLEATGTAGRFPSDEELRAAIVSRPLYGRLNNPRLTDTLWELELAMRTGHMERTDRPDGLWVEHVMPRSWGANWPLPPHAPENREGVSDARYKAIDTLGNLTLVTSGLNISMGHECFDSKREKLGEHTLLLMNKRICDKDHWDEATIQARGEELAALAISIWKRPDAA